MNHETRCGKSHNGTWTAESEISLDGDRVLNLRTYKASFTNGKLVTTATVSTRRGSVLTHAMGFGTAYGDFSERVLETKPTRVTEKVVREQHAVAVGQLPAIKVRITQHYERQAELNARERESLAVSKLASTAAHIAL